MSDLGLMSTKIVIKGFNIWFVIICTFCFLMLQMVSISNFLMIGISNKKTSVAGYLCGWVFVIILYFIWIIVYSVKQDYVIFGNNSVQNFQTDLFLQTQKIEIPLENIEGFSDLKIRRRAARGHRLILLTKNSPNLQKEIILSNAEMSEKKMQKLLNEIRVSRDAQNWKFNVFESEDSISYFDSKSTFQVIVLILIYILLPFLTYFLFSIFRI